jgi:3-oxoacyl-(acyl-carrier-protein) synthase III
MNERATSSARAATQLPVRIAGSASLGPGQAISTAELVRRLPRARDAADIEARSGIVSRHFADAGASYAGLGAIVLRRALDGAGLAPEALTRIVFVSSLGGDLLFPATANVVAASLGLAGTCDCFDLNNACMGFLTAFDLAARGIATGQGPVAIVVVELGSRYITPEDPRPFLVFADAAVAVVLERARGEGGMLGSWLRNDGVAFGNVRLAHPGLTGKRESIRFTAPSARMSEEAVDAVRRATDGVLAQAGVALADVQWILPHQPNGALLDAITSALAVEPGRVIRIVQEFGSIGAASIPVSLDRLLRTAPVRPGDRVLMVGVGAGISSGAVLLRLDA